MRFMIYSYEWRPMPIFVTVTALWLFVIVHSSAAIAVETEKMKSAHYTIRTTWDNQSIAEGQQVDVHLRRDNSKNLAIEVSAPFYDDPRLPDMTRHPGTMDKLYNYEVVEVFLLGENDHYLEVELGPRGQYLVLELNGYRNVTRYPIDLPHYHTKIDGKRWKATATVPYSLLPSQITRFNAYAIHGSGDARQYLALFPAPHNHHNFTAPDFHRLELFGPISIFDKVIYEMQ